MYFHKSLRKFPSTWAENKTHIVQFYWPVLGFSREGAGDFQIFLENFVYFILGRPN